MSKDIFKTSFSRNIFRQKYAQSKTDTWEALSERLVDDVCGTLQGTLEPQLSKTDQEEILKYHSEMKFIAGGRYLYYAGRPLHAWNNCFLLKAEEDTREEWGALLKRSSDCLMVGGGIGIDYSVFRGKDAPLSRTGGKSSGPIPLMVSVNEHGRNVMQGGSRRSAIYASLNWQHPDIERFLAIKDWKALSIGRQKKRDGSPYTVWDAKQDDFNFPAPLDMTNISPNYDDSFLKQLKTGLPSTFVKNVRQALSTAEPGFSFNFGRQEMQTLRNACTEVVSENDSDVCNLGSVNMANVETIEEFKAVVQAGAKFLVCGTTRADLPYDKVYQIREKNRRLGLGLMGIHEWLLKRGYAYEVVPELKDWLHIYEVYSKNSADELCNKLSLSLPVAYRAIAPTGSIGILASTTTAIEPMIAVAFKRRYLTEGTRWKYEYVVDVTADHMIKTLGIDADKIETAYSLAETPEKRIKFQADVQDYVDMAISSTINLPQWGSDLNNEDKVIPFAKTLAEYAPRLRGFTCYPDGSRGGQPLTSVPYHEALKNKDMVFDEVDICDLSGKGGTCGG